MTSVIDAKEERDVMTLDVPNAFIQTNNENYKYGEHMVMKVQETLVDILAEMALSLYKDYVVFENGKKVLYLSVLKTIYGILKSA